MSLGISPYTYRALEIEQQPGAPHFYIMSVPASNLLEWCDVPRAKAEYMAGYQRALQETRADSITEYLEQDPRNIIPGAIIVTVDAEHVVIRETEDAKASDIKYISVDRDMRTFDEKLAELWGDFTTRLSTAELRSADLYVSDPEEPTDLDDEEPGIEGDEDDSNYPLSYLARLAQELGEAVDDFESLPANRQDAIRAYIDGTSKPGLIIDGQHRVFGAKNVSSHEIHLPVVLLPGLPRAEQVFEFYVLNSTARPLKKSELRRIVSTTLTDPEIEQLYLRFRQAGVDPEEAQWTYQMNTHPTSPFRDLIDFGLGLEGACIPENVADQVVRRFMKLPRSKYRALIDPVSEEWSSTDRRLELFFAFWNAISSTYSEAWQKAKDRAESGLAGKDQIFYKVALLTLQEFVLNRVVTGLSFRGSAPPPFSSEEELAEVVGAVLANLPEEFFTRQWKQKQIDTSEGRKLLYSQMEAVWDSQGKIDARAHSLFREPT